MGDINRTAAEIKDVCDGVRDMLLAKNARYGDSALDPVRVFSRAAAEEQIKVRIDDKLSRIARGAGLDGDDGEDMIDDTMGYLVLLKILRRRRLAAKVEQGSK